MLEQKRPEPKLAEVLETKQLTASTYSIRVAKPAGFSFLASQSALLMIEKDYGPQRRPMSIASSPLARLSRMGNSPFRQRFQENIPLIAKGRSHQCDWTEGGLFA